MGRTMERVLVAGGQDAAMLHAILAVLRERTGTDFSVYRPAMVERRVRNRMIALGFRDFLSCLPVYLGRLRADREEAHRLLEHVTIKVSRFYRNRPTFDALRRDVLPALAARAAQRPLRIWSAGCAFGEEPYTLALLLAELGRDDVIDATDIDSFALERARAGVYLPEALEELPIELRERYFEPINLGKQLAYRISEQLRTRVRFTHHDLTVSGATLQQAPFDLVACRNVLIYLQRDAQERAFQGLRSQVAEGGVLCLGEAEWPPPLQLQRLSVLDRKSRLFWASPELAARRAS